MKDIDYAKLDPGCVNIVRYFNSIELRTKMCCEGHGTPNQSLFWVEFDKSIPDEAFHKFIHEHSRYAVMASGKVTRSFISNGHFYKQVFVSGEEGENVKYVWRYIVGNATAANLDVDTYTRMDNGEILWNGPSFVYISQHEEYKRKLKLESRI